MSHNGLLRVAEDLVQHDEQCFQKSAINRAYYASYHFIKKQAEQHLGFVETRNKSTHKQLSEYLTNSSDENIKAVGIHLRNLHHQRTNCDYKLQTKLDKNEASLAILMSKNLITTIQTETK